MLLLLTSFTTLYLFVGIFYFGRQKTNYSHISDAISELGEIGSTLTERVRYGLFLPAGLFLFSIAWLSPATVLTKQAVPMATILFSIGAMGMLAGTIFISIAGCRLRGIVQHSMEVIMVGYLLILSWGWPACRTAYAEPISLRQ